MGWLVQYIVWFIQLNCLISKARKGAKGNQPSWPLISGKILCEGMEGLVGRWSGELILKLEKEILKELMKWLNCVDEIDSRMFAHGWYFVVLGLGLYSMYRCEITRTEPKPHHKLIHHAMRCERLLSKHWSVIALSSTWQKWRYFRSLQSHTSQSTFVSLLLWTNATISYSSPARRLYWSL